MNRFDRDGNPIPEDWYKQQNYQGSWSIENRVARTDVADDRPETVSTVWLGLDHAPLGAPPLIFETMIRGGRYSMELQRYTTEEQALRGHLDALDRLRAGLPPFPHLDPQEVP